MCVLYRSSHDDIKIIIINKIAINSDEIYSVFAGTLTPLTMFTWKNYVNECLNDAGLGATFGANF